MKKFAIVAVLAIAVAMFTGCGNSSKKSDSNAVKQQEDSLAYAMGLLESQQMKMTLQQLGVDSAHINDFIKGMKAGMESAGDKKKDAYNKGLAVGLTESMRFKQLIYPQLFANDSTKTLPMDKFMAGFTAGMKNKPGKMTVDQAQTVFQRNGQSIQNYYFQKAYGANKKKSEAYMASVSKQPGVKPLGQGVYYKEVKAGNGNTPTAQDMTKVNYVLKDADNHVLDKQNNCEMPVSGTILGWTEAMLHMKEGATWEVYVPYDAAYGAQGKENGIKPYTALHFTITLLSIEKGQQGAQQMPQGMPQPQQVR